MPSSTHRWVLDSLEEHAASVEVDGDAMVTVPQSLLPAGARPGDVLRVTAESSPDGRKSVLTIEIDERATKRAMADSAAQVEKTAKQKNDPGGDITL
jgi:hypothetical protein